MSNPIVVPRLANANNTKINRSSSIALYNRFAKDNGFYAFALITCAYLCSVVNSEANNGADSYVVVMELFSRFANYLTSKGVTNTASGYFAAKSAKQHFSNLKNAVIEKTNNMCTYLQPTAGGNDWCDRIFHRMFRQCATQAIERGEPISSSSDAIWRQILIDICRFLVSKTSQANRYLWRVVFITLYSVIGRAGESATATWNTMRWHTTLKCPLFVWSEVKTGKDCQVTMYCDASSWEMCWWHAMFCYLMTSDAGSYDSSKDTIPEGVEFLFPYLQSTSDGVSSMVTKILHKLAKLGVIPGLTMSHSSHGFKAGASDDASLNSFINIIAIVCRANWDYSGQVRSTFIHFS